MADALGLSDDQYLSTEERQSATDLMRQFDAGTAVQARTAARYGLPQLSNQVQDASIARATAATGMINKARRASDMAAAKAAARGGSGGGGYGGGGGGDGGGTKKLAAEKVKEAAAKNDTAGLMKWLPLLMGNKEFLNLKEQGLFKYVKDAFGNDKVVANINSPQAQAQFNAAIDGQANNYQFNNGNPAYGADGTTGQYQFNGGNTPYGTDYPTEYTPPDYQFNSGNTPYGTDYEYPTDLTGGIDYSGVDVPTDYSGFEEFDFDF